MAQTAFYGRISSGDVDAVRSIFENWLGTEKLNVKLKLSGEQIVHEDSRIYVYCYRASGSVDEDMFLLEGRLNDGLDETKQQLERLLRLCKEHKLVCDFEYVALDEAGDQTGDQFQVE
jgi:hypothetical protein